MKIVLSLCLLGGVSLASSCCCTGEPSAPRLRWMPHFKPLPAAPAVVAEPAPAPAPEVKVTPAK